MTFRTQPTLCFKASGRIFSVTKVCEATNTVHASLTRNGRRLRGRPRQFPLASVGSMTVRPVYRSTR